MIHRRGGDRMRKQRYSEEQIAFVLKQAELGAPVEEVCRKIGVSEQTFYRWKLKFGGMLPSDMRRLRQLEEENTKFKKLVADLVLIRSCCRMCYQKSSEACPTPEDRPLP